MKHKKAKPGLEALYARIDAVKMSTADRQIAKASLAQADALADFILGTIRLAKRLLAPRARAAHTSA
jgi:hypothetical protein